MHKYILIILYIFILKICPAQSWIRIYGDSSNTFCYQLQEHYDKGYLMLGKRYRPGANEFGWLMKTDVNGFERWHKMYGDATRRSPLFGIDKTDDGGVIVIGQTNIGSLYWQAHVIKINACGDKEWCRIYQTPGRSVYGLDIQSMPGGGSIAFVGNWGYDLTKTNWLLRLDDNGNIMWQQAYAYDSIYYDPEGWRLFKTHDTNFLITGYVYAPDSGQVNPYEMRPLIIKVKPDGTQIFQLAWGTNIGFRGGGFISIDDNQSNVFTGAQSKFYSPFYTGPCLIKTSQTGVPLSYNNLVDSALIGGATTINWFQDSTLVMGLIWRIELYNADTFNIGVIKTDRFGNQIKYKPLIYGGLEQFNDAKTTYNNKLIIVNSDYYSNNWIVQAFKINSELDYDSIYTTPFTYDSLCPHPIITDTIPLNDCGFVVVGVDDQNKNYAKTQLHIYPNPVKNIVTIEMPQYLIRKSSGYGVTATTYYHQWNTTTLEIFDLFGKLMSSKEIPKKTEKVELDVSSWHAGMYVARVVFMNEVVAGAKFVVE